MPYDYYPALANSPTKEIFPGVRVRTCWTDHLMLSLVELAPHAVVPEHQHPHEQAGMVMQGKARFIIDGVEKTLEPGEWYRIPGNVRHQVIVLDEFTRVLDVFSPPREEYK